MSLMDLGRNLVNTAGSYYAGQEGVEGARAAGQAGLAVGGEIGQAASEASQFKPYTVTSNLATATTTPEGGLGVTLSPEEQARQNQYLQGAQGLLGGLGVGTEQATTDLYNQIRAAQLPEEERARMRMQEGLFTSGRAGLQQAQYGGTGEQFAYEKARQEAMLNAQLGARQQVGAEQLRNLQLGQGLQTAGYNPQNQAIGLFGASQIPAQLASRGQLSGAELQAQGSTAGLEGFIRGEDNANNLREIQLKNLLNSVTGSRDPLTGDFGGGLLSSIMDLFGDNSSALSGISSGANGGAITGAGGFQYAGSALPTTGGTIDLGSVTGTGSGTVGADGTYIADFY